MKYRVRAGFVLHPVDGSEPIEGPSDPIELTDEEATIYAAQIELADDAAIKAALAAEAKAAAAAKAALDE